MLINKRKDNAITLVALIITIIILLILSTIAILELKNTKLFNKATESKNKYKKAEIIENNTLDDYANKIDEFKNGNSNKIIDNTPPEIKIESSKSTKDSITIIVSATDSESGMPNVPEFEFYIKEASATEYPAESKKVSGVKAQFDANNLTANTEYSIKIITRDKSGNQGIQEENIKTEKSISYGTAISDNYDTLYYGLTSEKSKTLNDCTRSNDGNYHYAYSIVNYQDQEMLNKKESSRTSFQYVYSGTKTYTLATKSGLNRWVVVFPRAGGLTTGVVIGNIKLGFEDGSFKTFSQAVSDKYIEPLVICAGGRYNSVGWFNAMDILSGKNTNSGNYPEMLLITKTIKYGVTAVSMYSNVNFNTTYDGLRVIQLPKDFEISTTPW